MGNQNRNKTSKSCRNSQWQSLPQLQTLKSGRSLRSRLTASNKACTPSRKTSLWPSSREPPWRSWPTTACLFKNPKFSGDSFAYKPNLMGGSIEYDVSLGGVNSGCVAGVYLVESDNSRCSPDESQD